MARKKPSRTELILCALSDDDYRDLLGALWEEEQEVEDHTQSAKLNELIKQGEWDAAEELRQQQLSNPVSSHDNHIDGMVRRQLIKEGLWDELEVLRRHQLSNSAPINENIIGDMVRRLRHGDKSAHWSLEQSAIALLRSGDWTFEGTREGSMEREAIPPAWAWNPIRVDFWDDTRDVLGLLQIRTAVSFAGITYRGVAVRRARPPVPEDSAPPAVVTERNEGATARAEKLVANVAAKWPGRGQADLYKKYKEDRKNDPSLPPIPRRLFPALEGRGRKPR